MTTINLRFDDTAAASDRLEARIGTPIPAGQITGDAPAPSTITATVTLVAPIGSVSPSGRPGFVITVDAAGGSGLTAEVQFDTDPAFPNPGGATVTAPAGQSNAQVTVQGSTDLADGVWYWRARIAGPYGAGPWSATAQFAVNSAEGQAALGGSWTVDARTGPATHLWYIDHTATGTDSGAPGVLVGTGFGTAPRVLLGDLPCTVTDVRAVPVPAGAPSPRIEPGVTCTVWHQQLTFVIPGVDPDHDGDALTVIGGN